jgi:hypothetical protein
MGRKVKIIYLAFSSTQGWPSPFHLMSTSLDLEEEPLGTYM